MGFAKLFLQVWKVFVFLFGLAVYLGGAWLGIRAYGFSWGFIMMWAFGGAIATAMLVSIMLLPANLAIAFLFKKRIAEDPSFLE